MQINAHHKLGLTLIAVGALAAIVTPSFANTYPGGKVTFTSAATNTKNLFNFSGSALTITGDLTGANKYYLNGVQLIGIRTVYMVNTNGSAPTNISFLSGSGYVAPTATSATHTNWVNFSKSGFMGFDNGASGVGYSNGSNWIAVADPTLAGKTAVNNKTFGSFKFTAPLVNSSGVLNYMIGIDYLVAGGQSGRAYFSLPKQVLPTPEAGTLASFGVFALVGAAFFRRRKQSPGLAA